MKHFTIENETNNIMVHTSVAEADAVPNSQRFGTEAALGKLAAEWPAARLVEIWNSLPGVTPLSKFKDRSTAVSRIWKALQSLGAPEPQQEPDEHPSESVETSAEPEATAIDTAADVAPQSANVAPEDGTANNVATPTDEAPVAPAGVDNAVCSELLQITARTQETYWEALRNLESAIGFEIDDPGDLKEATVESLIAQREARRKPRPRSQATRENSKTAQVIGMLKREGGATLDEIMTAMRWQKHTTRAMLSAGGSLVKNHGLAIVSEHDGEQRRYSIKP
ncbi:MAG TPA: DUF3489 domain-containing protein [Bryobacteraceae bacterium]|nr:DUF3489 domain-containing protein [Bryobacteraceae bacterium]